MMKFFSKKMLLVATVFASSIIAEECEEKAPAEQPGHALIDTQMCGAYNAPARYDVKGSLDLFITASFIYWQPSLDGLALGITFPGNATTGKGHFKDFDFGFKPGFKVGMGINLGHDNWDLYLEYTRLTGDECHKVNAPTDGSLYSFWGTDNGSFDNLKGRYENDFNFFDLSLSRPFYQGTKLTFTPSFGMRGGWMDHEFKVVGKVLADEDAEQITHIDQDTWFIGPRLALIGNWHLGEGFRLFGNIGASLFYQNAELTLHNTIGGVTTLNEHYEDFGRILPDLDAELGLAYASYFADNDWHVDLMVGYKFEWIPNQSRLHVLNNAANWTEQDVPGDLSIQGLTITARLDF